MLKEEKQREILFSAIKKVATNNACPEWIKAIFVKAVKDARSVKEESVPQQPQKKQKTKIEVNDIVTTVAQSDALYEVLEEVDTINGVRLFNIKTVKDDINNNVGHIFHNVPETMLKEL